MTPLLNLSDDELAALSPAEVERLERAALVAFQTARKLTRRQWDAMVEGWNDLPPDERRLRHAYCARHRHDWVGLPMDGCRVCRRCCSYRMDEP